VNLYSEIAVSDDNVKKDQFHKPKLHIEFWLQKHHLWFDHHSKLAMCRKVENLQVPFQRAKLLVCLKLCQIFTCLEQTLICSNFETFTSTYK